MRAENKKPEHTACGRGKGCSDWAALCQPWGSAELSRFWAYRSAPSAESNSTAMADVDGGRMGAGYHSLLFYLRHLKF